MLSRSCTEESNSSGSLRQNLIFMWISCRTDVLLHTWICVHVILCIWCAMYSQCNESLRDSSNTCTGSHQDDPRLLPLRWGNLPQCCSLSSLCQSLYEPLLLLSLTEVCVNEIKAQHTAKLIHVCLSFVSYLIHQAFMAHILRIRSKNLLHVIKKCAIDSEVTLKIS